MSNLVSRRSFLFTAAVPLLVKAQDQAKPEGAPDQTKFSTDVNVVNVLATVRDKKGQIVRNLTKDDFAIEEDTRPQTIRYFSQESNLPLTLGLLVDTSGSMRNVLDQERDASYKFFQQVLRPDKDKAFIIHFDREVVLIKDLTSSEKELEAALGKLQTPQLQRTDQSDGGGGGQDGGNSGGGGYPGGRGGGRRGGGTLLYDAVYLGSDEILKKQQGRKAIILLTDGMDRGSKTPLPGAIESAQRADTLVYSIMFADSEGFRGVGGPGMGRHGGYGRRYPQEQRPDGKKVLEQISKETGGGFYEVSKKQPIDQIYEHIEEELRNQYSLGYTPDKALAGYHKITVTVKEKGLVVQARDGFYEESKKEGA